MTPEAVSGIFAIVGALVGASATYTFGRLAASTVEKRRHLTIRYWPPRNLTKSLISSGLQFEVTQKGRKVPIVSQGVVEVRNDGRQPLKDLCIFVSSLGRVPIIGTASNFKSANLSAILKGTISGGSVYQQTIEYLNPNEHIMIFCYFEGDVSELFIDYKAENVLVDLINLNETLDRLKKYKIRLVFSFVALYILLSTMLILLGRQWVLYWPFISSK